MRSPTTGKQFAVLRDSGPRGTGDVELIEAKLQEPLHWRKPRRVFVNSMSDLFHEALPDDAIDRVFAVMALCPHLTFQVLTKRAERMRDYLSADPADLAVRWGCAAGCMLDGPWIWDEGKRFREKIEAFISGSHGFYPDGEDLLEDDLYEIPLTNVQFGVSVEDQPTADARIAMLLQRSEEHTSELQS